MVWCENGILFGAKTRYFIFQYLFNIWCEFETFADFEVVLKILVKTKSLVVVLGGIAFIASSSRGPGET